MSSPIATQTVKDVSRGIVAREIGETQTTERAAAAGEQICVRLYREVGRWVGVDGCDALIGRALAEVRAAQPVLGPVRSRPRQLPHLEGLASSFDGVDPVVATEAVVAFLEVFIELLGAAIGVELAQRLVVNAWREEESAHVDQEKKHHDW